MKKGIIITVALCMSACVHMKMDTRYNEYALKLVNNGLYEEAAAYLLKADKLGDDIRIKNNLAICYEAMGEKEKAEEYYQQAIALDRKKAARKNYEAFKSTSD